MKRAVTAFFYSAIAAQSAIAAPPELSLPIDCILGDTCYIQNYVDRDAGDAAVDFTCANLTYNGHKGTDFALPSLAAMAAGVNVLAAAPGLVVGVRDGMRDVIYTDETKEDVRGRDCGNGVVIRHRDGWETQYCHMRQGSIAVQKGMHLDRGTILGQVGLSGHTQFPHAHLSLRHNGQVVDPFDTTPSATCTPDHTDNNGLWKNTPNYVAGGLLYTGFSTTIPSFEAIKSDTARELDFSPSSPAMILWGFAFGGRSGDRVHISIVGPQGRVIDQTAEITRNQAQFFRATGKKRPRGGWPKGLYTGSVSLIRDIQIISQKQVEISVK